MRSPKSAIGTSIKGELTYFDTPDRIRLCGFLSRPRSRTDKIVIFLHGLQGAFYTAKYLSNFSDLFTKGGFNFMTIEQRGSYSIRNIKKGKGGRQKRILLGGAIERFEDCVYDIEGAITFARGLGMKRVYLAGHSTGCQKATYYQSRARNRSVKGVILIAPADDYNSNKKDLGGKFNGAVEFARKELRKDRNAIMPKKYLEGVTSVSRFLSYADPKNAESRIFNYDLERLDVFRRVKVPVLALFGTREQFAVKPVAEYMRILAGNYRGASFRGVLIRGANHAFKNREEELAREIARWLESQEAKRR